MVTSTRPLHPAPHPQVEPHVSEGYAERDWAALSASGSLKKLTNDQLK